MVTDFVEEIAVVEATVTGVVVTVNVVVEATVDEAVVVIVVAVYIKNLQ